MFHGSAECIIDGKGRVSIPAKYLEIMGERRQLIFTRFFFESDHHPQPYHCLDIYPLHEWQRFVREFRGQPRFDPNISAFENFYIAESHGVNVDTHGRILLPPPLRDYAGLRKLVKFTAALEKFRVWDKASWERYSQEAEARLRKNPEIFNSLRL